jgi:hypothetical protein
MVSVGERVGLLPDPQFDVVQIADGLTITRMSLFSLRLHALASRRVYGAGRVSAFVG